MVVKLLQLNIFQGKFLDRIIDLVKKEDFDILHFQEVTGNELSKGGTYNFGGELASRQIEASKSALDQDCFEEIKIKLGLNGELLTTHYLKGDPTSYYGNATFYKKNLNIIGKEKKLLSDPTHMEIDHDFTEWEKEPRGFISVAFEFDGKKAYFINTHLAWGPRPDDKEYKLEQARKLYDYVKSLDAPFVLSGDFNVTPETKTASMFNDLGKNLTVENSLVNTLNLRVHPAKHLEPGLAVDYIIVSKGLEVKNFKLIEDIDLSDHLALFVEIEV